MADELGRVQLEVAVDLATLQTQLQSVKTEIEKLPDVEIGLKIDKEGINNQLNTISRQFQKRADYKVGVSYTSLTNAAEAAKKLKGELDSLNSRKSDVAIELNLDTLNRQVSSVDALLEGLRDARPIQLKLDTGLVDDAAASVDRLLEQLRVARPILLKADTGNVEEVVAAATKSIAGLRALPPVALRFDPKAVAAAADAVTDALTAVRQQATIPLKFDLAPLKAAIRSVDEVIDTLKKQEAIRLPIDVALEPARAELAAFRKEASIPIPVVLDLQVGAARQEAENLTRTLTSAQLPVDLQTDTARTELNKLRQEITKPAAVPLALDPAKANAALATFRKAAAAALQIPLSAVTKQAEAAVQALRGKLADPLPLEVTADTSGATTKIEAIQQQLNELVGRNPYVVTIDVRQTGQNLDFLRDGKFGQATRGATDIAGLAAATVEGQQAAILRDELLQRVNAPSRKSGTTDFGTRGLRQFLEATPGGIPEGITSKSVRADLQGAARQRLNELPDQTLLGLAQTLREINAKLVPSGGSGGNGPIPPGGPPSRSWLDQVARMVLTMAGLDEASIRQQVQQQQRLPSTQGPADLWGPGTPVPFQPARPPGGTPLLTGISPIERALLRDPALRDPRRLLEPDGGLGQPSRFDARRSASATRNQEQTQRLRIESDLANNAARSQRILPSGLNNDLKEALRDAAAAFKQEVVRQAQDFVVPVDVRDLGARSPLSSPALTGAPQPRQLRAGQQPALPESTAAGDAARFVAQQRQQQFDAATQAARARSAAREQSLRELPALPPASAVAPTRRRRDQERLAAEFGFVDSSDKNKGSAIRQLQAQQTRRARAEFRLDQQREARLAAQPSPADAFDGFLNLERQRRSEQSKRRQVRTASARKGFKDATSNAIIGGAFPALFGQGVGASVGGALGGAAGALLGPIGGFGGSLLGTAAGAAVDTNLGKLPAISDGLKSPIEAFAALKEAALLSSKAVEKNAESLIKLGETEQAAAVIREDLNRTYGGSENRERFENASDGVTRTLAELTATMAGAAAIKLTPFLEDLRKMILILNYAAGGKRPALKTDPDPAQAPDTPAVAQAKQRSQDIYSLEYERANLSGSPDTPANRSRIREIEDQLAQKRYEQQYRTLGTDAERTALSRTNSLQEVQRDAQARAELRADRLALKDAQLAGGRQVEDARIGLRNDRETLRFIRPEQSGSELAVTTRQEQQALLLNRERAFENLSIAQERNAPPAEIETATSAFKTAQLDYERGVLKSAKALATAAEQIEDSIRGLTRQREDLSTGLTATAGSDEEGINKYITPQQRRNRQEAADRKLSEEANEVAQALGVKATFTGDIGQQNAQKADFVQKGRQELRGNEDLATLDRKLGDLTTSMTEVKTSIDAQTAAATQLKEATDKLTGKNWIVNVSVNSGSVSGDARAGQIAL